LTIYFSLVWLFLKKAWIPYLLFILQIFWANIHGFFILGPLFIFIFLISEVIKRHVPLPYQWNSIGRISDAEFKTLQRTLILLILACFVNPQFVKGFWFPIQMLMDAPGESKFFYSYIGELHRSLSPRNIFDLSHRLFYKILIVLSLAGFIINRRKIDLRILSVWLVFFAFSWAAVRNVMFFGVIAYLSIIINLSEIRFKDMVRTPQIWHKPALLLPIFLNLGLIGLIINQSRELMSKSYFDVDTLREESFFGKLSDKKFPRKACAFITQHKLQGNFFNNLEVGMRLIIRHYPNIKVYIHGLTEVFGAEFFETYHQIWDKGNWDLFEQQVKKYNITGAFLSTS